MEAAGSGQEEEEQMQVDIYVTGNSKRPDSIERWAGYLVRAKGGKKEVTGAVCYASTLYASFLMIMVEALNRFTRPADITIHVDNSWITSCLIKYKRPDEEEEKSLLDRWQENGWLRARGEKLENKDLWQRLYNKLRVFEQAGGNFSFEILEKDDKNRNRIIQEIEKQIKEV